MTKRPHFPLLAKVLGWLLLHLLLLAFAFVAFVGWQLRLGLDSLLSGSAGERLRSFGEQARGELIDLPRPKWNAALEALAGEKNVAAAIHDFRNPENSPLAMPANVLERVKTALPPPPPGPPDRRGPRSPGRGEPLDWRRGPPLDSGRPPGDRPERTALSEIPTSRPVFLLRGDHGNGYWAGIQLMLPGPQPQSYRQHLLIIRADRLDGSGMFFDFKPWLWGGLAVLGLSLAFWTPFVLSISRYLRRLTAATDRIAAGDFKISLPPRGNDELGNLGAAVEAMAVRLDHLVSGQKRFLGDAAHELCAPLARMRTGLGILEMKPGEADQSHLASIESDAQELATLVEEILAFSRVGNRPPRCQLVRIEPLVQEIVAREGGSMTTEIQIATALAAMADPALLGRAFGNLVRNARIHAGPDATLRIDAAEQGCHIILSFTDNGPGVPADELARLFEPFYRPDRSRSRDTGGNGLGLAIVRTAIEVCGGETSAETPPGGGFAVILRLPSAAD
jgi:two-component system sensor histidine kinase CpxA